MRNGRWNNDRELQELCGSLGTVRAAHLESRGLRPTTVYRRCQPGGPWRRLLPGIILLQASPPNDEQRVAAATLYCGTEALVTGLRACRRHGLRPDHLPEDSRVHMLIPHGRRVQSRAFVVVERTHRMPAAVTNRSVRMAPMPRAICDAARRNTRYASAGIMVVQTLPSRLLRDQLGVLRELTETYRAAERRPRPALHCDLSAA